MTLVLPDNLASFEPRLTASQFTRITAALAAQRDPAGPVPGPPGASPTPTRTPSPPLPASPSRRGPIWPPPHRSHAARLQRGTDFSGIHVHNETSALHLEGHSPGRHRREREGTEAAAATVVGMTPGAHRARGPSKRSLSVSTTPSCSSCATSRLGPCCSWARSPTRRQGTEAEASAAPSPSLADRPPQSG